MLILVNENQLDEWVRANAEEATGIIVELVSYLIAAACPRPTERRFPLGDSIGQHGPDGILDTATGFEPFVPEGYSLWQIGTNVGARDKATEDYKDLTGAVPEAKRSKAAFVFVTPLSGRRDWKHTWKEDGQAAWVDERRNRGEWRDVRVIDGTRLIDWVRRFPAVEMWLAQRSVGGGAEGVDTPDQHWSVLSSIGQPPPLVPDLFLADRGDACDKLKQVLDGKVVQLKLSTHHPEQVAHFVSAYLASLDEDSRAEAASRCLLVSGRQAWHSLCSNAEPLLLVADRPLDMSDEAGTMLIQKARRGGHSVVFGGAWGGIPDPTAAPLPMPKPDQVRDGLLAAGYSSERARALAHKSGGNLNSLLRCLQNLSTVPAWAEGSAAADLAIAVVLGSWTDGSEGDQAAAEELSGKPYGEWIGKMREMAVRPGTPLLQNEGNWRFVSRYEGWYALGPILADAELDTVLQTAVRVLQEPHPRFELPPEKRHAASVFGKELMHSPLLRIGLAETLALLGSHPAALTSCRSGRPAAAAVLAVRRILADADWIRWASLDRLLPLLAEAAPEEFLCAVERTLEVDPCPFDDLFAQEDPGPPGGTYMAGLLWALETLAWDADHLTRAVLCLGQLAERDPGGRWANRPAESLTSILLPWLPQTYASITRRTAAVRSLLDELPRVGWRTLLKLLPQVQSSSMGTRRPRWRETIPDDRREHVPYQEYRDQLCAYVEMATHEAKKDVTKLADLVAHLERLPPAARSELTEYLQSEPVLSMAEEDRLPLWNELSDLVLRHRRFSDAEWAMDSKEVDRVDALVRQLEPFSPFLRHQRLFRERGPRIHDMEGDYGERIKRHAERCQSAVNEVYASGGTEAVIAFAQTVEAPWRVGVALGMLENTNVDNLILPSLLEQGRGKLTTFTEGFIHARFDRLHWRWVDRVVEPEWSSDQIGRLLSLLPFTRDTWDRAQQLLGDDEKAYWEKVTVNRYDAAQELDHAVGKLMQYARPLQAMRCLDAMVHRKQPIDTREAARVLLCALQSPETPHPMDGQGIASIIKAMQDAPDTDPDDLVRVEWACLRLLDGSLGVLPISLWRRLADDPEFFCSVIQMVFRSEHEENRSETSTEEGQRMAEQGYRLLKGWRVPPGLRADEALDGEAFRAWLKAVRKRCSETGHLDTAMSMVGQVLRLVPPEPDGLWMSRAVAKELDAKSAGAMRDGFRMALYNARGVHWVDPSGRSERELAASYRGKAEEIENAGFPRLASTLRGLADEYEREAERVVSRERFDA